MAELIILQSMVSWRGKANNVIHAFRRFEKVSICGRRTSGRSIDGPFCKQCKAEVKRSTSTQRKQVTR